MKNMTQKLTIMVTLLFLLLLALPQAKANDFNPDYGIYFEWIYARVETDPERYSYIWGYGQRFGATVLAIQGEMFKEADQCVKFEGESRPCTSSDFDLIKKAFLNFQAGEIIEMPEWVFNTAY